MSDSNFRIITLPDEQEMMQRLVDITNEPRLVKELYPLFVAFAGKEMAGEGVVMRFTVAIATFLRGKEFPPQVARILRLYLPKFVVAVIDDEEARNNALKMMRASGIPC